MAINLISLKCPECGALLSIEENRSTAFCTYCGAKVIVHNENERIQKNITVDAARIRESDNEREIQLKELDVIKDSISSNKSSGKIYVPIGIVLIIIGIALIVRIVFFSEFSYSSLAAGFGAFLLISFGFLFVEIPRENAESEEKKVRANMAKRRIEKSNAESPGRKTVLPPIEAWECLGRHQTDVEYIFREAGFKNIIHRPIEKTFLSKENNELVTDITIGGNEEFEIDSEFYDDVPVIITYKKKK